MARAVPRSDRDDVEPAHGPAMAALANDRHRDFVTAFVTNGGNGTRAAMSAGFSNASEGCKVRACNLLRREDIRAAISEESRRYLRAGAPAAVALLHRILRNPRAKDADRLRAADVILQRCDPITTNQLIAVEHNHVHRHTLSADQVTARILELAGRVGVDVKSLPPCIDAAAVEVPA